MDSKLEQLIYVDLNVSVILDITSFLRYLVSISGSKLEIKERRFNFYKYYDFYDPEKNLAFSFLYAPKENLFRLVINPKYQTPDKIINGLKALYDNTDYFIVGSLGKKADLRDIK
ncbi:MAG: hypothetical protein QXR96_02390 [Candidatus Woesearchaeota archaeon]